MAIANVQSAHKPVSGAASVVVPIVSPVKSGNTLFGVFLSPTTGARIGSVTDNLGNPWTRAAYSWAASANAELWYSRGIAAGAASVTATYTTSASATAIVSEFSGVWFVDPLDQWSQNYGTSASPQGQVLTQRQSQELVIAATCANASVSATPAGYTAFTSDLANASAAYYTNASSTATQNPTFTTASPSAWAAINASFVSGASGSNPRLRFPETLVEMSTTNQYLNPINGVATWTNFSQYVRGFSIGPHGRQHELDRVQSSACSIKVDNRLGYFNSWSTNSYLYNNGYGLKPMNPIKIEAAWNGVTYFKYLGYLQSTTLTMTDVLNVDGDLTCQDLFQLFSLKYLDNPNYANQVIADGAAGGSLLTYWRLGDPLGSNQVHDSSGNGITGSISNGQYGGALFGQNGTFLTDSSTSVDLTNGSGKPNAGIVPTDYSQQPPVTSGITSSGTSWSFECWAQWSASIPVASTTQINGGTLLYMRDASYPYYLTVGAYDGSLFGSPVGTVGLSYGSFTAGSVSAYGSGSFITAAPTPQLFDGNVHHIVLTQQWDPTGGPLGATSYDTTFYVDGVQVGQYFGNPLASAAPSVMAVGTPLTSPTGLTGITPGSGGATAWPGLIQDVAFYNFALSPAQVANHYAMGQWFVNPEVGASSGDQTAGRLNKVLAVMGINPSTALNVPYPFKTQIMGEPNNLTTTSGLNYIQSLTETEPGIIFQAPNGQINAYNRQYQYLTPMSTTSQALFEDAASVQLHFDASLKIATDDLDVWNSVSGQSARSGAQLQKWGPSNSSVAATSASAYGPRTMQGLTGLKAQYDYDVLSLVQQYAYWYNLPLNRVNVMSMNAWANLGQNLPQMLGRGLMDRVSIVFIGQGDGSTYSQQAVVESISDTVDMNGPSWQTTWALSPYEILLNPIYLGVSSSSRFSGAGFTGGQLSL